MSDLIKKARRFWDEAGLGLTDEEKAEIKAKGDHNGDKIALKIAKAEHDKIFDDHAKELDAMLNAKHLY